MLFNISVVLKVCEFINPLGSLNISDSLLYILYPMLYGGAYNSIWSTPVLFCIFTVILVLCWGMQGIHERNSEPDFRFHHIQSRQEGHHGIHEKRIAVSGECYVAGK